MRQNKYEYDAFISHAVEDKIPIANELCAELERAGLKIWYSGKELGVGDSIEKTIEKGLNRSRYGIVIFSPTYLAKNWTIREFYTLLAKEIEDQKVILPVLYNITLDELKNRDMVMADRFAVNADRGMDFVVERLVREIRKSHTPVAPSRQLWFSKIWLVLVLSLLVNVAFLLKGTLFRSVPQADDLLYGRQMRELQAGMPLDARFLDQFAGLFRQMNTCSCDHRQSRQGPQAGEIVEKRSCSAPQTGFSDAGASPQPVTFPVAGRKMMMAVVFQIETPASPSRQGESGLQEADHFTLAKNDRETASEGYGPQWVQTASLSK